MYEMEEYGNDYLKGHLLGYSDQDIETYYKKNSSVTEFNLDKEFTAKWLKEHQTEIENILKMNN